MPFSDLMEFPQHHYEHVTGDFDIRVFPNPILKEVAEPFSEDEFGPELFHFGSQMVDKMRQLDAHGISANQVGILKRIFVMQSEPHGSVIVCNPQLELGTETDYADEGCLSLPGVQGQVVRSSSLRMRFRTPMGDSCSIQLTGLNARIVQHETDHLDGISFVDRMPRNLRKQVERSFAALSAKKKRA